MDSLKDKNLMVIDGSSLVFRAFYALPPLTTKDGLNTNSIYGFLNMMYRLQEDYDIDYIAVVFDKKGPTFRHKIFKDYKGNRDKTPSELLEQIPIIKDSLAAMNIELLELDDYEADDIAGTLAKLGEERGMKVSLVTGDKDYLQLASKATRVLITKRGITEMKEYYAEDFTEEFGLEPDQLVDLIGLMGDPSDNIPGVPGIGEKTGIKLLKDFGSLEGVYENLDKVTGKKRLENLIANEEVAYLSKDLGRIRRDLELDLSIEDLKLREHDYKKLLEIYEKLNFRNLLSKLPEGLGGRTEDFKCDYEFASLDMVDGLIKDIEDLGEFSFKFLYNDDRYVVEPIIGLGLKIGEKVYYFDDGEVDISELIVKMKDIFENPSIEKSSHRVKSEIFGLLCHGIELRSVVFDSQVAKYLIDPSQSDYAIAELAREYLGLVLPTEEELLGKGKNKKIYGELDREKRGSYIAQHLLVVDMVREEMLKSIGDQEMDDLYYRVELPLSEVLAHMEYEGISVDAAVLRDLGGEFDSTLDFLTEKIYLAAGQEFNINSPKQMGEILFDVLELPVIKKTKTGYSTDAEVLGKLKGSHEIIDYILEYRQIAKLKTTYIDGLLALIDEDGKIHSTFNQTVASTGRISSAEPNLQNIPIKTEEGRKIRRAFKVKSEDYLFVDGDYSQIELRVLAHISQDEKLMEAFFHDEDVHTRTAAQVFRVDEDQITALLRNRAKAVNFGIIYGISDYGLARDLEIPRSEAREYIDRYLENYNMVHDYMDDIVAKGKIDGYVETILKRRRYIPELESKNFNVRGFGERIAMNTPIQGSAADIIKLAMVELYKKLREEGLESKLILQIHDELIIETKKSELDRVKEIMRDLMENAIELKVPLKVDIVVGDNWYDTM